MARRAVLLISAIAIVLLGVIWWVNGSEDTWFYVAAIGIVLSGLFYGGYPKKKD